MENKKLTDNRLSWDERAKIHYHSNFYDVESLTKDSKKITDVAKRDYEVVKPYLPAPLSELSLLHLQCHIGTDTLSFARLGAKKVAGLDFSKESLHYAKVLAEKNNAPITYYLGDAQKASEVISDTYDVIITGTGAITWLSDLKSWAHSIAELLNDRGVFLVRDDHPLMTIFDFEGLEVKSNYFPNGKSIDYEASASYIHEGESLTATKNHNWPHSMEEITQALLEAGLTLTFIGEYPYSEWQALPQLVFNEKTKTYHMPKDSPQLPLTFAVVATKNSHSSF